MTLLERFERQENEDIVLIGELIEKVMRGEFGALLRIILTNLQGMEIANSRNGVGSSDKVLGRLEAYQAFLGELESFVARKNEIQTPLMMDNEETFEATDPSEAPAMNRGGAI